MELSQEQREFVEKNHNLIYGFLHKYGLDINEWYDLMAIAFCKAVIKYDPGRSTSFSTFAYFVMMSHYLCAKRDQNALKKQAVIVYLGDYIDEDGKCEYEDVIGDSCSFEFYLAESDFSSFYNSLDASQRSVFNYCTNNYSQREIARRMGFSQPKVSRILKRIKKKFMAKI